MSRPIYCDGPGCGQRANERGTVLVLQAYPPGDPTDPTRTPLVLDFCGPLCLSGWALGQLPAPTALPDNLVAFPTP